MHEYAQITTKAFHLAKMQDMEVYQISAISAVTAYLINRHYLLLLKIYKDLVCYCNGVILFLFSSWIYSNIQILRKTEITSCQLKIVLLVDLPSGQIAIQVNLLFKIMVSVF